MAIERMIDGRQDCSSGDIHVFVKWAEHFFETARSTGCVLKRLPPAPPLRREFVQPSIRSSQQRYRTDSGGQVAHRRVLMITNLPSFDPSHS